MAFLSKLFGGQRKYATIDVTTYHDEHFGKGDHVLIDVRSPEEFNGGHLPGALNIPLNTLAQHVDEVPQDQPVFMVCRSGSRSDMACTMLANQGYENLTNIQGGTMRWRAAGYPVE